MNIQELMEVLTANKEPEEIHEDGPEVDLVDAILLLDEVLGVLDDILVDRKGLRGLIGKAPYSNLLRVQRAAKEMVDEWSLEYVEKEEDE